MSGAGFPGFCSVLGVSVNVSRADRQIGHFFGVFSLLYVSGFERYVPQTVFRICRRLCGLLLRIIGEKCRLSSPSPKARWSFVSEVNPGMDTMRVRLAAGWVERRRFELPTPTLRT